MQALTMQRRDSWQISDSGSHDTNVSGHRSVPNARRVTAPVGDMMQLAALTDQTMLHTAGGRRAGSKPQPARLANHIANSRLGTLLASAKGERQRPTLVTSAPCSPQDRAHGRSKRSSQVPETLLQSDPGVTDNRDKENVANSQPQQHAKAGPAVLRKLAASLRRQQREQFAGTDHCQSRSRERERSVPQSSEGVDHRMAAAEANARDISARLQFIQCAADRLNIGNESIMLKVRSLLCFQAVAAVPFWVVNYLQSGCNAGLSEQWN